jgi:hypothetical protein
MPGVVTSPALEALSTACEAVDDVDLAGLERLGARGVLGDLGEDHLGDTRGLAPVAVVPVEPDLAVGLAPGVELERPRPGRVLPEGRVALDGRLRDHGEGEHGQVAEHRRVLLGQFDLDRVVVGRVDRLDDPEQVGPVVRPGLLADEVVVAIVEEPAVGRHEVLRGELLAVVELDTLAERQGDRRPVQ